MAINCNLTESDYRAFRNYVRFRYRKLHWYLAIIVVSLLSVVWFSHKPQAALGERIASVVGVLIAWVVFMLIFLLIWKIATRLTGGRFRGCLGPHVFEIGEETFTASNSQGRQEVRLTALRRMAETDSYFFIITNAGTGYVIPKRDLQSYEALHVLQKKVAKRRD